MTELSSYLFSELREGELTLYRGSRGGRDPILLVVPDQEYSARECVKRLENEYTLRAALDPAWAARPVALVTRNDRMALVLEDPGGEPLDRLLGRPMDVKQFLRVAVPLAAAIQKVHERGLIHKDVKPANILVDIASGSVWLTGFGFASRLPRERQTPAPPKIIAGMLAYMAPEQTGRMNRSIDARSDLYSLGVTLYEMLTGQLPFVGIDPMEWLHCHIARQPMPPSERLKDVPVPVSAIIIKLLAKTAEERYQTAAGAESNLRRCLEKAPLNINEPIQEVIALVSSDVLRSKVKLLADLAADLPPVVGDRVQLQQVILNLILNAKDAMSAVQTRPRDLQITSRKGESGEVVVAVRDSGKGLEPRDADRIFDPFFSTKPEGMGLGLSISRSIIEAHGGTLWATSNADIGAIIQFALPPGCGREL